MAIAETLTSTVNDKTVAGTTVTIGTDASRVSDTLLVVALAFDNLNATTPTVTLNKPGGETNSWAITHHDSPQAAAAAGVRGALAYILTTTSWTAHSLVATLSGGVTAKGASFKTFTGASATIRGTATAATGTGNMVTDASSVVGDLAIFMAGSESPADGTAPTLTSADETVTSTQLGGTTGGSGVTNATVILGYAILGTAGARTMATASGVDGGRIIATLAPAAAATSLPELVMAPRN